MKDHQQRAIDEKADLDGKIERLNAFIKSGTFKSLAITTKYLMFRQHTCMEEYSSILSERIAAFKVEA